MSLANKPTFVFSCSFRGQYYQIQCLFFSNNSSEVIVFMESNNRKIAILHHSRSERWPKGLKGYKYNFIRLSCHEGKKNPLQLFWFWIWVRISEHQRNKSEALVFICQPSSHLMRQSCEDKSKILIRKNEKYMAVAFAVPIQVTLEFLKLLWLLLILGIFCTFWKQLGPYIRTHLKLFCLLNIDSLNSFDQWC